MAIQRPDTPLANTPIPKPYSQFSESEKEVMDSMKNDPRIRKERLTKEEGEFYKTHYMENGKTFEMLSEADKIRKKFGMTNKNK
jgi:hypothetical protein